MYKQSECTTLCEWNGEFNVPPFTPRLQGKETSATVGASS